VCILFRGPETFLGKAIVAISLLRNSVKDIAPNRGASIHWPRYAKYRGGLAPRRPSAVLIQPRLALRTVPSHTVDLPQALGMATPQPISEAPPAIPESHDSDETYTSATFNDTPFGKLPNELLEHVARYLFPNDLAAIARVAQRLREVTELLMYESIETPYSNIYNGYVSEQVYLSSNGSFVARCLIAKTSPKRCAECGSSSETEPIKSKSQVQTSFQAPSLTRHLFPYLYQKPRLSVCYCSACQRSSTSTSE
jgi:hypothetical protein